MITIVHKVDSDNQNVITLHSTGITMTDFTGNMIEMSDSAFTITSAVAFTIDASGQNVEIKASAIDLISA